jgi:hypothetical protein
MSMHQSIVKELGSVGFPVFIGERVYMRRFTKNDGLPLDLARWQPTVDAMLRDVDATGPVFIMIDQAEVRAGASHRRPGVHVDGYWLEELGRHGGGHHGKASGDGWDVFDPSDDEAIVLASDVQGCVAYVGPWSGEVGHGGACDDVDFRGTERVLMNPRTVYAGNVAMLHESLPVRETTRRTLVRLNVPGWSP